jgi:predicted nuclease of predicted toxin-antitoxin system
LKLLFDQNLSRKLVNRLSNIFLESSHVQFQELSEADDSEIWEVAKSKGFCIVTQDADFADRSCLYGSSPKVMWLRYGNATTVEVERILRAGVEVIQELIDSDAIDCLELY